MNNEAFLYAYNPGGYKSTQIAELGGKMIVESSNGHTYEVRLTKTGPESRLLNRDKDHCYPWRPLSNGQRQESGMPTDELLKAATALQKQQDQKLSHMGTQRLIPQKKEHCKTFPVNEFEDTWLAREVEFHASWSKESAKVTLSAIDRLKSRVMLKQSPPFCPLCQRNMSLDFSVEKLNNPDKQRRFFRITATWRCK